MAIDKQNITLEVILYEIYETMQSTFLDHFRSEEPWLYSCHRNMSYYGL